MVLKFPRVLLLISAVAFGGGDEAATVTASDCVTISKPEPSFGYTYEHQDLSGKKARHTDFWEEITDQGSRLRVERAGGKLIQANEHHIANDVVVLDRTTKKSANGGVIESTVFHPGLVSDPASRVCAGRTWQISSVTATYQSARTKTSTASPVGLLKVIAVHETITVPAGKFDTVHYTRTSQSIDEYWKSIEQGVVIKHIGRFTGGSIEEVLWSIR